ncbi:MAG: nitroreductase family protein [Planctomycetota bacterium]
MTDFPFVPLEFSHRTPREVEEAARRFDAAMQTRRSVRDFSPEPVSREVIESVVRTAGSAPSGAHKQPWHFVAVSDPEIKHRIRVAAEAEERENYERRFPDRWKDDLAPLGTDWHKEFLEIVPWLIVVFRVDYGLEDGSAEKLKHYYVSESVGIASGFLIAAIHQAGLVTLTHTPSPMGFLARILGRPANEKPYLLLPVGYPAEDARVPDLERKPLDEILTVLS